jgi:hypothetical protein
MMNMALASPSPTALVQLIADFSVGERFRLCLTSILRLESLSGTVVAVVAVVDSR